MPTTPEERMIDNFWRRVVSIGKCWVWQGSVNRYGYGIYRHELVHRFAYRLLVAPPDGFVIRHACDNPICCRPDHLIAGTQKENMADKVARGRARGGVRPGQYGELNNSAKVSTEQAQFALDLYAAGYRQVDIARLAGLTLSNTHNIVHRQTWTHLKPRPGAIQEAPRVPRRDRRSRTANGRAA